MIMIMIMMMMMMMMMRRRKKNVVVAVVCKAWWCYSTCNIAYSHNNIVSSSGPRKVPVSDCNGSNREDYGKLNQGIKNRTSDQPQTSCLCFCLWFRNHRQVVCGLSDILSDILSEVQTSDKMSDKTSDNAEKLKSNVPDMLILF